MVVAGVQWPCFIDTCTLRELGLLAFEGELVQRVGEEVVLIRIAGHVAKDLHVWFLIRMDKNRNDFLEFIELARDREDEGKSLFLLLIWEVIL